MTPSSERSIKGLLNAFSWAGSGSVKGACGMVMCGGEGIHLPLTGSGQHLPWRLWPLMGHHRKLLITFLNNAYFIRVKTNLSRPSIPRANSLSAKDCFLESPLVFNLSIFSGRSYSGP